MSTPACAIVGGGVAGSCAALALAKRGIETVLLEAGTFPRHKVCGEFFSPESRAVLRRLGVEEILLQNGARKVFSARIVTARRELEVELPGAALAISRYRMDELLWKAAREAGVLCRENIRVRNVERDKNGWKIETNGQTVAAYAVISATGRRALQNPSPGLLPKGRPQWEGRVLLPLRGRLGGGRPIRHFGLKAHFRGARLEPGVVELHPWRGGYCGLVRVENDITNVCLLARYESWNEVSPRTPEAFWQWLLAQCPALRARLKNAERTTDWLTTGNVSFGKQEPQRDGVLHCGDAAGYIHPLTGDGMAMAARSAELAAAVVAAWFRGGSTFDAAQLYAAAWQREFDARLTWSARVEPLLTHPRLAAPALALLEFWPELARRLVKRTRS